MPLSAPAQALQSTINAFTARSPEVTAAALASSDGLLICASDGFDRDHADELAAVAVGVVSIVGGGGTGRMFDDDRVELAVCQLSHRTMLVRPVVDGSVLAVITTTDVDISAAGRAVHSLAQRIGEQITPDVRIELMEALPL